MKRFNELVAGVRDRYPGDTFFVHFESSCKAIPLKLKNYKVYERAFLALDPASWKALQEKALDHYLDHRPGQLKQGFFNQLNEAFAYRFLKNQGFKGITFVPESKQKSPDLSFLHQRRRRYCEVKTLSISEAAISRRAKGTVFDGSTYSNLGAGFFNKIRSTIDSAMVQLAPYDESGLVFLFVTFDDFTFDHYSTYRRQLNAFLQTHSAKEVRLKLGLVGQRSVAKGIVARGAHRA